MEPEMMSRSGASVVSPLGADVMRAYDAHQAAEAESVAGWVSVTVLTILACVMQHMLACAC